MNATQVTALSTYDDIVWDYWKEYHATQVPGLCRIVWNGVWERNPLMCVTVKAYLWALRKGTAKQRPLEWSSIGVQYYLIRSFATHQEAFGQSCFSTLTESLVTQIAVRLPQARAGWHTLRAVERMLAIPQLPYLPRLNPFQRKTSSDWISPQKVNQTRPLSDELIKAMIERCLGYEKDVQELVNLAKTRDWDGGFAMRRHIRNGRDLNRAWRMSRTAGLIMMLAATGMRGSEVVRIERGGLICVQGPMNYWCIRSRIFKFHAGKEDHWVCGLLGQRAYQMLSQLTEGKSLIVNSWEKTMRSTQLNAHLCEWMEEQGFVDDAGFSLEIHSHQFRRTLARRLIRYPKVNLLAMRDHFKHKTIKMTDYYVGCDDELRHAILARYPNASLANFQADMRRRAGLDGAA